MENCISAAAKVRSLFGNILNEKIYDDLISKNSVSDIAAYLKANTIYKEVLNDMSPIDIHRGNLEILLKKQFLYEMQRIYRHLGDGVDFFYDLNLDFELEILKDLIRGFLTDNIYLGKYGVIIKNVKTKLPLYELSLSHDADDFLFQMQKANLFPFTLPLLMEKNPNEIHTIENNLDLYYFHNLWKSAKNHFNGADLDFIQDFIATRADLYNIELILKSKKFYNWNRDRIIPNLVNIYGTVDKKIIYEMADSSSLEECLKILKQTKYSNLAYDDDFDILVKKYILSKYIHKIRASVDIKALVYYFRLKQIDISNITTITEAVRYDYSKYETKKLIVYK